MKINSVELTAVLEGDRQAQLLVLRSDSNLIGRGEIAPSPGRDATERSTIVVADLLVGRDPFNVQALLADSQTGDGTIVDIALVSAATTAMLDLAGQSLNVPIHQFLGGNVHDRLRACAVGWAEGASEARDLAVAARRTAEAGYTALRVEPFANSLTRRATDAATAFEIVRVVRDAVPDSVDLVVAADGELGVPAALEFADSVRAVEPLWIEEPVPAWQIGRLRDLAARTNMPLAAGRGSRPDILRDLATSNLVDHLIVDVGRVGGLLEARRIAALAEIFHVGIVPTGSGGSVSLRAALQFAGVLPNFSMVEVRPGLVTIEDGMVAIDDRPGFELDAAKTPEVVS